MAKGKKIAEPIEVQKEVSEEVIAPVEVVSEVISEQVAEEVAVVAEEFKIEEKVEEKPHVVVSKSIDEPSVKPEFQPKDTVEFYNRQGELRYAPYAYIQKRGYVALRKYTKK